jgi:hypothetical protein
MRTPRSEESSLVRNQTLAVLSLAFLLPMAQGRAQDATPPPDAPGEEPQVTIIERGSDVVEEYRLQGKLYMVKVTPRKGPPYYLIDTDGDGNLETRRGEMAETPQIPSWILFKWK